MPSSNITDLSARQQRAHESYERILTKKVRQIDLSVAATGQAVLTDEHIWIPPPGRLYILLAAFSVCTAVTGTVSAARISLQVNNTENVASVAPAVAVNTVVTHTVVASIPFSKAHPLDLTTILSSVASSVLKVDLVLVAVDLGDIYGD